MILFAPEKYDANELAWSVSAEVDALEQHLKNFDVAGQTNDQGAYAGALQAVVRERVLAPSARPGIARDLNYVVRNVPGFIPFETLPEERQTQPEIFGSLSADYYIPSLRLTPGIGGGIQLPSTFQSDFTDGGRPRVANHRRPRPGRTSQSCRSTTQRRPIYQARVSLKWEISEILKAVASGCSTSGTTTATLVVTDPNGGHRLASRLPEPRHARRRCRSRRASERFATADAWFADDVR